MRRKIILLLSALGWTSGVLAAEISVNADAGYRMDRFDWTIAGNSSGANPNILSELAWRNMDIAQARLGLEAQLSRFYLRMRVGYGEARNGANRDSDYLLDNHNGEFSRSNNRGDGVFKDGTLAVGYRFDVAAEGAQHTHLMPLIGYATHRQNLVMTNGFQTIPATGSFNGLHSTYDAMWNGPWLGISMWERDDSRDLTVSLDMEYHRPDYEARADWNLRSTFMHPTSYQHWADGEGVVVSLNTRYGLTQQLALKFGLDLLSWKTNAGIDRVYLSDGSTQDTQFNGAHWDSAVISLGAEWTF